MNNINLVNVIKSLPLFKNVDEKDIIKLSKIAFIKKIEKGKAIFLEGEKAEAFYFMLEGKAKIYKLSSEGKEQILRIVDENDLFGEVPALQNKNYPAYSQTITDCVLLGFHRNDFISLMKQTPELSVSMIAFLCNRLEKFTALIETISLKEVPTRLANYFLALLEDNNCPNKCFLKISKSQLASVIGTVPETLSRALKKIKDENIIDIEGNEITIVDFDKLTLLSQGDIRL
jgi:CRP/FNR family transcriptional regulator